jgi:hypothetical protein
MPKNPFSAASYDVGYGKPPRDSRFKPGQSGNPRGRPTDSKRAAPRANEEPMKALVLNEAYRRIKVRDGERMVGMPVVQAILRSLALSAAKGHQRSQRLFTELVRVVEHEKKALKDQLLETAIEYKVGWEFEIERCERLGITPPTPISHPDDVVIDLHTATVEFRGPLTKEDKEISDWLRKRRSQPPQSGAAEDLKS